MSREEYIDVLHQYKAKMAKKYGILSMGIFGSIARNEMMPHSDLDVFLQMTTPNPFYMVHIKNDLERIIHRKVDVVRLYDEMNSLLKKRIEKEGLYV